MAIPWPSSPAVGDTFTYGGITYTWNGVAWVSTATNTPGSVGSVAVTAPITNTGTSTAPVIGIDQTGLTIAQSQVTSLVSDLALKAPLASPTFTGTVTVPNLVFSGSSATITLGGTAGTSGQVLTSAGAASTPTWTTVSGGSFTGGTLTSDLVLAANGTATAPLKFQSGTLLSSVTAGVVEYDGTVFYQTPNTTSGRALNPATYYYTSSSSYSPSFAVSAAAQSMLGATTKGITVLAGTTYEFEFRADIRHQFVTTAGITGLYNIYGTTVSGSPVLAHVSFVDYGSNTTGFTTATTMSSVRTTGSVTFSAAISSGSRYNILKAKGTMRITGSGSMKIYPGLSTSATSGDNIWTIGSGLMFKMTPIGNGTVTGVNNGSWA